MGTSRHASWEDEEEGSNMWNSTGSQGNSSSYSSVGWSHGSKRGNNKVCVHACVCKVTVFYGAKTLKMNSKKMFSRCLCGLHIPTDEGHFKISGESYD